MPVSLVVADLFARRANGQEPVQHFKLAKSLFALINQFLPLGLCAFALRVERFGKFLLLNLNRNEQAHINHQAQGIRQKDKQHLQKDEEDRLRDAGTEIVARNVGAQEKRDDPHGKNQAIAAEDHADPPCQRAHGRVRAPQQEPGALAGEQQQDDGDVQAPGREAGVPVSQVGLDKNKRRHEQDVVGL